MADNSNNTNAAPTDGNNEGRIIENGGTVPTEADAMDISTFGPELGDQPNPFVADEAVTTGRVEWNILKEGLTCKLSTLTSEEALTNSKGDFIRCLEFKCVTVVGFSSKLLNRLAAEKKLNATKPPVQKQFKILYSETAIQLCKMWNLELLMNQTNAKELPRRPLDAAWILLRGHNNVDYPYNRTMRGIIVHMGMIRLGMVSYYTQNREPSGAPFISGKHELGAFFVAMDDFMHNSCLDKIANMAPWWSLPHAYMANDHIKHYCEGIPQMPLHPVWAEQAKLQDRSKREYTKSASVVVPSALREAHLKHKAILLETDEFKHLKAGVDDQGNEVREEPDPALPTLEQLDTAAYNRIVPRDFSKADVRKQYIDTRPEVRKAWLVLINDYHSTEEEPQEFLPTFIIEDESQLMDATEQNEPVPEEEAQPANAGQVLLDETHSSDEEEIETPRKSREIFPGPSPASGRKRKRTSSNTGR